MVADDVAKKLIQERARVAELFASAVNSGMRTLKMDGMEKVLMGLTDFKMVRSVCIKQGGQIGSTADGNILPKEHDGDMLLNK